MFNRELIFINASDASKVAEQLYNCSISLDDNTILIFHSYDPQAVDTAIQLADVALPLVPGARCPLPFPKEERECKSESFPQIYVCCLSAYVAGIHHGMWIDAARDADEIQNDIEWMLSYSPATGDYPCEEWAIHAYENFEGIRINEYESIETVAALATAIEEHGRGFALFQNYYNYDTVEEALTEFQERFCGVYESSEDFAYKQWDQDGTLSRLAEIGVNENFINWDAVVTDYESSGDYLFLEAGRDVVYVFYNN